MERKEERKLRSYFDRLWPICRSLTGRGFRDSLAILKEVIPLEVVHVPSGTRVHDWKVPLEWNIDDAYVLDENGARIIDFQKNNLHVLGYSTPVEQTMSLEELEEHLYSLPELPEAIPYLTSYYKERWGFCLTHRQREALRPGWFKAVIKSSLTPGNLTYGHLVLPSTEGRREEVLISTYLCHPSMANNELSGPLLAAFLYKALERKEKRTFNYRFVFIPETIGAITYLSQWGNHLKENCVAGLVVTCCGDNGDFTYKKSRRGNALIDRCVLKILQDYSKKTGKSFNVHDFFPTGSDERQYCSPGFNLPVGSLMRSMYGTYKEYHTSLDNQDFISFAALEGSLKMYEEVVLSLEANKKFINLFPYGEPMLGPRGLYPTLGSSKEIEDKIVQMNYVLNFSDGDHDLLSIAEKSGFSILELAEMAELLKERGLLKEG